jgi:hypothetical protein
MVVTCNARKRLFPRPKRKFTSEWVAKTWSGTTPTYGTYFWSDGTNVYYSNKTNQYVLTANGWEAKTWGGLSSFIGSYIWFYAYEF